MATPQVGPGSNKVFGEGFGCGGVQLMRAVGSIPYEATEDEIMAFLSEVGAVKSFRCGEGGGCIWAERDGQTCDRQGHEPVKGVWLL